MPKENQAPKKSSHKKLRRRLKVRLVERELTVLKLSKVVGHDISTVSKAINHGTYPNVLTKVQEALNV